MKPSLSVKKIMIRSVVGSLSAAAILGVLAVANAGDVSLRGLGSTLAIGGFSLSGLCASMWIERERYRGLSLAGLWSSGLGLTLALILIWSQLSEGLVRAEFVLIVLAAEFAYVSVFLLLLFARAIGRRGDGGHHRRVRRHHVDDRPRGFGSSAAPQWLRPHRGGAIDPFGTWHRAHADPSQTRFHGEALGRQQFPRSNSRR